MSTEPKVTVLMPVYNAEQFVADAIESILGQDFEEFEFVVIDDGSTDGSAAVIERYARSDDRMRVFRQPNSGLIATLNWGVDLARAELIARMDADDMSLPGRLHAQHSAFQGRENLAVVGGFTKIIDERGQFIRIGRYPTGGREMEAFIERGSPLAHPAVMMRRSAVADVGGYRAAFAHSEDYDLWLRLHDRGFAIENLPFTVLAYRHHDASISLRHRRQQALGTIAARAAHQLRRAGHADPIESDTVIDETLVARLSSQLSTDYRAELLEALYSDISFADAQTLEIATTALRELPRTRANRAAVARLYLRCARGHLHVRRPLGALRWTLSAFWSSPMAALDMIRLWIRGLSRTRTTADDRQQASEGSADGRGA